MFDFRKFLKSQLFQISKEYIFHIDQLIIILSEMAKNTADHTSSDAFFGIDLVDIPERNSASLHFVFGDLGYGIKRHIENNLPKEDRHRSSHFSLEESYHYALTRGYTSNPGNRRNKGIGMSIILDGAKGINMKLSVFDAYSRGILSSLSRKTHEDLRRHFYSFNKDQNLPFYYYGSIEAERI